MLHRTTRHDACPVGAAAATVVAGVTSSWRPTTLDSLESGSRDDVVVDVLEVNTSTARPDEARFTSAKGFDSATPNSHMYCTLRSSAIIRGAEGIAPTCFPEIGDLSALAEVEHDPLNGTGNSLVQVDADTYALAYAGDVSDGYLKTFTITDTVPVELSSLSVD